MNGPDDQSAPANQACFATTHWSEVLAAGQPGSPAAAALESLCRSYWYPLYAYVRRRGYGPQDAQDLTQGFFVQLLRKNYPGQADPAKGKFRTFLLHTLKQFLADQRERAAALKRGGGQIILSLDHEAPEERYRLEPPHELTPEKLFERRWAQTILDRALAPAARRGGGQRPDLRNPASLRTGQSALSYAQAAARLVVSQSAVKSMIHRLRQRHRELVWEEIAHTVPTVAEIDEELRHLVARSAAETQAGRNFHAPFPEYAVEL